MTPTQYIIRTINRLRVHLGALVGNVMTFLVDSVLLLFNPVKKQITSDKVLIVRLDAIGDFVLWTESAKALRQLYPAEKYKLVLLGNQLWTDLATDLHVFDEVWPLNTKLYKSSISYHWKMATKIRAFGFHTVLQPVYSRLFALGDSVIRVSKSKEKKGFIGDKSVELKIWKSISDKWYTQLFVPDSANLMELERNTEFLKNLGLANVQALVPSISHGENLPEELRGVDYFILFPGASVGRKQWPVRNFAAIANWMTKAYGWKGIICGAPNEKFIASELKKIAGVNLEDWTGKTSLHQLTEIISSAKILIGNDTAALHIAPAVGTKSVGIVGGGHFGRFLPYKVDVPSVNPLPHVACFHMECFGCGWQCIYQVSKKHAAPCIANVTVENVKKCIVESLN